MIHLSKAIRMFKLSIVLAVLLTLISCTSKHFELKEAIDKNGYKYSFVKNDPINARTYELRNGLKVFLSYNPEEPRVATLIGVRAGSTSDPAETTGLAHYFEHLMFKGTTQIGALDWGKEKIYLDKITELFELHKETDDPDEKLAIYRQIDSVSQLAAFYVAPNEYDKLVSSLGAKRTNAGTSYESTVYINDIPSNEFEKWLKLESERFSDMVIRLFHTELETVYEEFNMYQDMDGARVRKELMQGLFQLHPYGRDIIGTPEDLKNPSIKNIYEFADIWYRPNNMAMAIAGDINMEEAIVLIDKYFGSMEPNPDLPVITHPTEEPINEPVVKEVIGPDAESLRMAFRFDGENSKDQKYVTLIDMILSNSQAGLMDINLNQKQKVLRAGSYCYFLRDYGMHGFFGQPRNDQTLEEVKDLMLEQLEKVKNGEFDHWMLEAVINDLRLSEIRAQESNFSRAFGLIDVFIKNIPYTDRLRFLDDLEKISKEDIMNFANENYVDNYVVVYKRTGENTGLVKMEKPPITPLEINREDQSEFYREFVKTEVESLKPVFIDFKNEIQKDNLDSGIEVNYIKNELNELFTLQYIIDMGANHNILLPLAVNYLPYLGTDKYSAEDLQKEFFKYGLSMKVYTSDDRCYISIDGLQKFFEKGVELLEHVLANVQPDQKVYDDYVDGILKKRMDAKLNKNTILWSAMFDYGKYGPQNPFTNIVPQEKIKVIDPSSLTGLIRDLNSYQHRMFYYGQEQLDNIKPVIEKYHQVPQDLKPYPEPVVYSEQSTDDSKVYFVDYDMSQVNILMLAKGPAFNKELIPPATLFGEYFGSGLSSIVFQEIREARGYAYSAFSAFAIPDKMDESHFVYGFVGTQADKLKEATHALLDLMDNMPKAQKQFDLARESIIKKIETERITKTNKFWTCQRNIDRGIDYDIRKDVYEYMHAIDMDQFSMFFNEYIKDSKYIFLVLGNKNQVDLNALEGLGAVKELTMEEIFNY